MRLRRPTSRWWLVRGRWRVHWLAWIAIVTSAGGWIRERTWAAPAGDVATGGHALVIGNGRYGGHEVPQAKAGAQAVAAAFRVAGLEVTAHEDLAAKDVLQAVRALADRTHTNGAAVVFFSGLGGQCLIDGRWESCVQGAGEPREAAALQKDSVAVGALLDVLRDRSSARLVVLLVDAAGPNPFQPNDHPRGMGPAPTLADDEIVCFAAAPGRIAPAVPGDGPGHFANAVAAGMPAAARSVGAWLDGIRTSVVERSGGGQEPAVAIGGDADRVRRTAVRTDGDGMAGGAGFGPGERPGQRFVNGAGMVFSWCPPGSFTMGDPEADDGDAAPVDVTLTTGFWMGRYEVTRQEYRRVTDRSGGTPRVADATWYDARTSAVHRNAPVTPVSWHREAKKFLEMLNAGERKAGRLPDGWTYGLPTEVEWEYACRAGGAGRYAFGDDPGRLHLHGNYADRRLFDESAGLYWYASRESDDGAGARPLPVGGYLPNAWGLFDMHGNVAELCADAYGGTLRGGVDPPRVSPPQKEWWPVVIRGGSWCSSPEYCRAGFRNTAITYGNAAADSFVGMRVVLRRQREATP